MLVYPQDPALEPFAACAVAMWPVAVQYVCMVNFAITRMVPVLV